MSHDRTHLNVNKARNVEGYKQVSLDGSNARVGVGRTVCRRALSDHDIHFSFLFYWLFSLCSYCLNDSERPSVSFLVLTLRESTSPLRVSVIDLFILLYDLRAVADVSGTWCWPSLWNCKRSSSTLPQGATAFQSEEWPTSTSKSPRLMSRPTGRFLKNCHIKTRTRAAHCQLWNIMHTEQSSELPACVRSAHLTAGASGNKHRLFEQFA